METITIITLKGETYLSYIERADVDIGEDTLAIGNDVVISYRGDFEEGQELTAIRITDG